MAANPYRDLARIFALVLCFIAGILVIASLFFASAALTEDLSQYPFGKATNLEVAILAASPFLIAALLIALLGVGVYKLYGSDRRQDKLAARSAVGCLSLTALGCGLWATLSGAITLITGLMIITGEPAGLGEVIVGSSGFIVATIVLLSIAYFIWRNYVKPQAGEQDRALQNYFADVESRLHEDPPTRLRDYLRRETPGLVALLETPAKRDLLLFLYESRILSDTAKIDLGGLDFRNVDLSRIDLSGANLSGIHLTGASLTRALLKGVNFKDASLKRADLSYAHLERANLWEADLRKASLARSNLREANLTDARVNEDQLQTAASLEGLTLPSGAPYSP